MPASLGVDEPLIPYSENGPQNRDLYPPDHYVFSDNAPTDNIGSFGLPYQVNDDDRQMAEQYCPFDHPYVLERYMSAAPGSSAITHILDFNIKQLDHTQGYTAGTWASIQVDPSIF